MTLHLPDLDDHIPDPDPLRQFQAWYRDAQEAGVPQYDAMGIATATPEGTPSVRIVLLKQVDADGFVFYTNYESRKGKEIGANPKAALVFFWAPLNRSVRVEGSITRTSPGESDAYFATRPRERQLSSLTSMQSAPVRSREELDARYAELERRFSGQTIPRPPHWGGYRVKPLSIEFWQQRFARLNDRILYTLQPEGTWSRVRLAP